MVANGNSKLLTEKYNEIKSILDSGASEHMVKNYFFYELEHFEKLQLQRTVKI